MVAAQKMHDKGSEQQPNPNKEKWPNGGKTGTKVQNAA